MHFYLCFATPAKKDTSIKEKKMELMIINVHATTHPGGVTLPPINACRKTHAYNIMKRLELEIIRMMRV